MSDDQHPLKLIPQGLYTFPMSITIPDGVGGARWGACPGMTLRDYFAGQAVAGWMGTFTDDTDGSDVNVDGVARFAYRVADAMLKARGG